MTKLKKSLNIVDVFCIASGSMISSGIFLLPGLAHAQTGSSVILSYFFAGLLAMTGMFSQAELVSAMPKAGGTYFYVTRSFGPAVGTINGLMTWFSLCFKAAFALIGISTFAKLILPENFIEAYQHLPIAQSLAALFCIGFAILNIFGIKKAGTLQKYMTFGLFGILAFYIIRGAPSIKISNFEPFISNKVHNIFTTAGFIFISYGGLLKVGSIAEEVKNPARTIPLAMIFSLFIVSIFYSLTVLVTAGVMGPEQLNTSLTPISDGAQIFLGKKGYILLGIAAILSFITTANGGIISASRYPLALSRDRLLPDFIARVNKKFKTPHIAILITSAFIIMAVFLNLTVLIKTASTVLILTFIFSNLSVIILRESKLQNYQPKFKSPLYPWTQILGTIFFIYILFEMGRKVLLIKLILIACGFLIYWFYGRLRSTRQYALLHLIERITAKELVTQSLETELKEIIQERDEIVKDRFDQIIENSPVLDIKKSVDYQTFFLQVANTLAPTFNMTEHDFFQLLMKREEESTTVISPQVAIPHVVLAEGEEFNILLARCQKGIRFANNSDTVHAVFVLVGAKNERNFHLRALAAIAQIVQDPFFDKRWMSAKTKERLRDVVLLGKRRRK